ncbi:MAG: aldo/keto reductase, partial [Rhodobacteraceae bacterium]|nr:aldo/keto reductase [Paracoccaceae bacterium]
FADSLEALGLDYVDLYLIHAPSGGSERVNEWRALVDLKAQGKA